MVILVVGCALCLCSCSCSKKPDEPATPDGGGGPSGSELPDTFAVTVTIDGGGGTYSSSTGSDSHTEGTSPVYTFTPDVGYSVQKITLDGATFYSYEISGYTGEPVQVPLNNIYSSHTIVATFYQMDFFVDCTIYDTGYAIHDGGRLTSDTDTFQHKGGSSPVYTIRPLNGYCVYLLEVDGEMVYSYNDDPSRGTETFVISEQFVNISKNHNIKVAFYQLKDLTTTLQDGIYYTSNNFLPPTMEDNSFDAVTTEIENLGYVIPNGSEQTVKITVAPHFTFESFEITFDGITYSEKISTAEDYEGDGFRYVAEEQRFYFTNLTDKVNIKTYARPNPVDLILYNYDTNESFVITDNRLYSYYVIDASLKDFYWYYSLSSNYTETSVYKDTEITTTGTGLSTIYHFYLDDDMICAENNSIILIYSTTDLKD